MGSVARVKQRFDSAGVVSNLDDQAVINHHFDVADFLLEHRADISTNWNSHEPASILHHLIFLPNTYESMRFLIDRGIDMTIKDYRWSRGKQTCLGDIDLFVLRRRSRGSPREFHRATFHRSR
jgi:hypothetical protein